MFQKNLRFKGVLVQSTCLDTQVFVLTSRHFTCSVHTAYLSDEVWTSRPQHLKKQFKTDSEQFSQGLFTLVIYFKTVPLKPDHFKW